ncbi:MAG: hypothetical protein KBC64_04685 [Simkaniaceae bacterium]|nr:hypothetical protein [Simkaniaceae bacterium]
MIAADSDLELMRRRISEDAWGKVYDPSAVYALSNADLAGLSEEQKKRCYEAAFSASHPMIYAPSTEPLAPYTLNFLWVNLNPQDRVTQIAQNIFGDGINELENHPLEDDRETQKTFMYKLRKWGELNPGRTINLWYDSALVTERARANTWAALQSISEKTDATLLLRDVRALPNIPLALVPTLHPGTPVYYRVDLLKVLIAHSYFGSAEVSYAVISDIDVRPMSAEQLFDVRTLGYLTKYGYVFTNVGTCGMENGFFVMKTQETKVYMGGSGRMAIVREVFERKVLESLIKDLDSLYKLDSHVYDLWERLLKSETIFGKLRDFSTVVENGISSMCDRPRKVVPCPPSGFNEYMLPPDDHRSEKFRFKGTWEMPYTVRGRAYPSSEEVQLSHLIDWRCEPLPPMENPCPPAIEGGALDEELSA